MTESLDQPVGLEKPAPERPKSTLDAAREKLHGMTDSVREQAARASELARERYGTASQTLRDGYGRASADLDKLGKDVGAYVRDNPGRSVLAAAAAGFVLGLLVRRSRRH
jgi:ElaB/YqjD/DUF883 family membrane-anchored ribosome-binding protein